MSAWYGQAPLARSVSHQGQKNVLDPIIFRLKGLSLYRYSRAQWVYFSEMGAVWRFGTPHLQFLCFVMLFIDPQFSLWW